MFHARTVMTAVSMLAVGLVAAASASSAQAHPATAKAANTTVTIKVANCEGCQVYVSSVMAADYEDVWEGPDKSVRNGEVSFKVPTDRTCRHEHRHRHSLGRRRALPDAGRPEVQGLQAR